MQVRTAVVTGGTDGIGKEIAFKLASEGIHLIVVGRNSAKGLAAVSELQRKSGNKEVEFVAVDLTILDEARCLSRYISAKWSHLDFLVHSAGFLQRKRVLTLEGVESNFAVNYLARFRLTLLLLPLLQGGVDCAKQSSRILFIGGATQMGRVRFEDVNLTNGFNLIKAIMQFQCASDIFTLELARRLASARRSSGRVNVNMLKYGPVKTNIRGGMPWWLRLLPLVSDRFVGQTAEQASHPAAKLLLDPTFDDVSGALFISMRRFRQIEPRALVKDPVEGARLWRLSEKLSHVISRSGVA
jgi:NAD(P)-dependent dehydrogenase (short-subunit alcohol dehydrogenase family)